MADVSGLRALARLLDRPAALEDLPGHADAPSRGVHVGNFYLVEKEGGEAFTDEDEEVLVLFASQAATAIANARTYRAEQRAHAPAWKP